MVRDETSLPNKLMEQIDCNVYNLSICGTSAGYRPQDVSVEGDLGAGLNGQNLCRLAEHITGYGKADIAKDEEAYTLIDRIDYTQIDYFVIAYGVNDYYCGIASDGTDKMDGFTYGGALRTAVSLLKEKYPQAKIVIVSPTYCQYYSYGKVVADSNDKDYGGGLGPDYVETAREIAEEYDAIFVNVYDEMGINRYNGPKYLIDATHLTETGREKYAEILGDALIEDYKN